MVRPVGLTPIPGVLCLDGRNQTIVQRHGRHAQTLPGSRLDASSIQARRQHMPRDAEQPRPRVAAQRIETPAGLERARERLRGEIYRELPPPRRPHEESEYNPLVTPVENAESLRVLTRSAQQHFVRLASTLHHI
jgi:hypothetical protein